MRLPRTSPTATLPTVRAFLRSCVVVLVGLTSLPAAVRAALVWEQDEITLSAGPFDEEAEAEFAFTNTGDTAVTITNIASECGCTVAALDKRTYAPGEKGVVKVVFTFGGRTGRHSKPVTVSTDEGKETFTRLHLTVDIPKLFETPTAFVLWKVGDPVESRTLAIQAMYPDKAIPVSVTSRDSHFTATVEADPDNPALFHVSVTPTDTETTRQTAIIVKTNAPAETPRVVTFYALIR